MAQVCEEFQFLLKTMDKRIPVANSESVLNSIEHCLYNAPNCKSCRYNAGRGNCKLKLLTDAYHVIKEQKEQIDTLSAELLEMNEST